MQAVAYPNPRPSLAGFANSINDSGMIVGYVYSGLGGTNHPTSGFLSDGHTSWDLNTLIGPNSGWLLTSAVDINDSGQIVGEGINPQGQERNYLLTPTATPEPASWLILASGTLGLAAHKMAVKRKLAMIV